MAMPLTIFASVISQFVRMHCNQVFVEVTGSKFKQYKQRSRIWIRDPVYLPSLSLTLTELDREIAQPLRESGLQVQLKVRFYTCIMIYSSQLFIKTVALPLERVVLS